MCVGWCRADIESARTIWKEKPLTIGELPEDPPTQELLPDGNIAQPDVIPRVVIGSLRYWERTEGTRLRDWVKNYTESENKPARDWIRANPELQLLVKVDPVKYCAE